MATPHDPTGIDDVESVVVRAPAAVQRWHRDDIRVSPCQLLIDLAARFCEAIGAAHVRDRLDEREADRDVGMSQAGTRIEYGLICRGFARVDSADDSAPSAAWLEHRTTGRELIVRREKD